MPSHDEIERVEKGVIEEGAGFSPIATASGVMSSANVPSESTGAAAAGLELIDDEVGPTLPVFMTDMEFDVAKGSKNKTAGRVEHIDDGVGPPGPVAMIGDETSKAEIMHKKTQAAVTANLEGLATIPPPTPFNDRAVDDICLKKPPTVMAEEDAILVPTIEEIALPMNQNDEENHDQGAIGGDPVGHRAFDGINTANPMSANVSLDINEGQENYSSAIPIPEAFLVEERDDEVIIATHLEPTLQWWKQKRVKFILALIFLVMVCLVVALSVSLTSNDEVLVSTLPQLLASSAPSISIIPTIQPTTSFPSSEPTSDPSISMLPSSSPTKCADKIVASKLDLQVDTPMKPAVAVDGRNLVIITGDARFSSESTYILFYSLGNDGWEISQIFKENFISMGHSIALSGKTMFVGITSTTSSQGGFVLMYEQNAKTWEKVDGPPIPDTNFPFSGDFVDIDGGQNVYGYQACVSDYYGGYVYIYRRTLGSWYQIDRLQIEFPDGCTVSGDVIAVKIRDGVQVFTPLTPDQDIDTFLPLQAPVLMEVREMGLSQHHLAFFHTVEGQVMIYEKNDTMKSFAFLQQLAIPGYDSFDTITGLDIDEDILVFGGKNQTFIFSASNGYWEETVLLDGQYNSYKISGRNLIAANDNKVYSFNIEDCLGIPTQMPSSSVMPTTCNSIEIAVTFGDDYPDLTWELLSIDANDVIRVVETRTYSSEYDVHTDLICINQGEYEIKVFNKECVQSLLDCDYGAEYNVTTVHGGLVAKGEGGYYHTKRFSIPFSPAPSAKPTESQIPTITLIAPPPPTASLTVSSSPTDACDWIVITVSSCWYYPVYPWTVQRIDAIGGNVQIDSGEDTSSSGYPICLEAGVYEFVVLDLGDMEIGRYHVRSSIDGSLIVEGGGGWGGFENQKQTTRFSIPYVPTP